ncbi:MAG: hypothetical protein IT232_04910 [Flavobacteriales bacterium]|nr:hypothetical protein [Flavobacteriales bacterium]
MIWEGNKINDHFINLYNGQNPESLLQKPKIELFENLFDISLALKDLYGTCAQNAWTKERMLTSLENIITSGVGDNRAYNQETYLSAKIDEAKKIKELIVNNSDILVYKG